VRPNKVNEILNAMTVPFALKAGMIGKLCLKVKNSISNSITYYHFFLILLL